MAEPAQEGRKMDNVWFSDKIAESLETSRPIQLPKVVTLIKTVDLGRLSGLAILGTSNSFFSVNPNLRACPMLVWDGPPDAPMFKCGGNGNTFSGFIISIKKPLQTVFQFYDFPGFADGKSYIEKISVVESVSPYDFITAGERIGDGHCDTLSVSNCRTIGARNFFLSNNNQSMGHVFHSPHTIGSETVFNIQAGGIIEVSGIWTSIKDKTLVRVKAGGRNNGFMKVNHLKLDSQTADVQDFKLAVSDGNPTFHLKFEDGLIPSRVSEKWDINQMFNLSQNFKVSQGFRGLPNAV